MQEQFVNLTNQNFCPPPPEPLIKPQNQAFFQDQFVLESGKHQEECCRSSIEEQTMSFNLSERDSESHVYNQQANEEKGQPLKRSLKDVHGERNQGSRFRLLTKLQRIDRMPAKRLHL